MLECPVLPVAAEREVGDVAPVEFLPGVHGLAAAPAAVDAVPEQFECALAGGLVVAAVGTCPGCAGRAAEGSLAPLPISPTHPRAAVTHTRMTPVAAHAAAAPPGAPPSRPAPA